VLLRTAYVVFGLDVRRQLLAQDLAAVGAAELRDMIRMGWAEMTEDEKEGYITRAGDDKDPVIAATKVSAADVKKLGEDRARARALMRDVGEVFAEALQPPDDLCA